ncbi:MAG: hypothetical protein ABEK59_08800 [Halobacteria archaeon]
MTWFPTVQWFEEYSAHINAEPRLRHLSRDWGVGWRGDFIFHIEDVPVDSYRIKDLPDELIRVDNIPDTAWEGVPEEVMDKTVREYSDEPIYLLLDVLDGSMRRKLPEDLREVLDEADKLFDINPTYEEVPEMVSERLREFLPEKLYELLAQLELFVEDGDVYAYMDFQDGVCEEIDVKTKGGSWDKGEVGYVLRGDFKSWERFTHHGDIIRVILEGGVEPEGDVSRLLQYSDSFSLLGDTVKEIDTKYLFGQPGL